MDSHAIDARADLYRVLYRANAILGAHDMEAAIAASEAETQCGPFWRRGLKCRSRKKCSAGPDQMVELLSAGLGSMLPPFPCPPGARVRAAMRGPCGPRAVDAAFPPPPDPRVRGGEENPIASRTRRI